MFVRSGKSLPLREYEDVAVRRGTPNDEQLVRAYADDAVLLCARNATRERMNARIRSLMGFKGPLPEKGEKIICTFNQHGKNFMNGEQAIVIDYDDMQTDEKEDLRPDAPEDMMIVRVRSLTDGSTKRLAFNPASFSKIEDVRKEAQRRYGGFDFGGCLTVHKSQGSEWDHVAVIDETITGVPYEKLAYTAYTRAINRLEVYKGN
jgi:exodeoxyribonuclease-5